MQTSELISAINEEIARLEQVKALLTTNGTNSAKRGPKPTKAAAFAFGANGSTAPKKPRKMSAAGRARIAAAQRARWAKLKKANSK